MCLPTQKKIGTIMRHQVNGILLLDKPVEMTSNAALQKVKRLFIAKKAGHTGSLDPIATGMLPICFGEATKFSQFLLESNKSYRVVAKLGIKTTTADCEGEIIETKPVTEITKERIEDLLRQFLGSIMQVPPMYSAIKYKGKPLYSLARKGIKIDRSPRLINIYSIKLVDFADDEFTFLVHCSKGTYIRTLVEDIGEQLGCGAHVVGLRRLTVTPYEDALMYTLEALEAVGALDYKRLSACLLPIETAVQVFPAVKLSTSAAFYLRMGQAIRTTLHINGSLVRLLSEDAKFLGVGEVMTDGRIKPHRLLSQQGAAATC